MPSDSTNGPPPDFDRLRSLFEQARQLPPAERQAFVVRIRAEDQALGSKLAALLEHAHQPTPAFVPGAPPPSSDAADRTASDSSTDKVHSTQTAEMLQRLARAPRLDLERYAIEGEVDRGGMGAILKILDRQLNRRLAMKVLLDREAPRDELERQLASQLLGRFLEEAQVTSQLDHPGVVPVHELGLDQHGKVYFTMRLVKGRTAREVFAESHGGSTDWPLTRALEIVLRVCDTMSYAHDKGVLHRDLKPDNVMVGKFGEVYVMDWGLAKVLGQDDQRDLRIRPEPADADGRVDSARRRDADSDDGSSVVTMDGQKLGTPSYMPPEQGRNEALDERADVYAIGAMLYHLLTGRAPYSTPGVKKPAYRILEDVAEGPPKAIEELQKGVPAELVAIVGKAMARERDGRYPTTAALAADLRAFLAMHAVQAYRTGALVELQLWVRRNKPLAASLLAAVLILVVGIIVSTTLANENAALAQQKTELAAAETKAKDDALAQKQRADEAAAANERLAQEKTALAQSESLAKVAATQLAAEKGRTVANFNQLSAVVRLKDVLAKQDALWPAWPDKVAALQAWLDNDCAQLLAQRPQIEATIAELRSRAVPLTAEQVETDRRAAAEWPAYERQQQLVASLRRAQAIRAGTAKLELPELPGSLQNADASALNQFAWPRVAPEKPDGEKQDRTTFGEEAAGLVAARAAVTKSAGTPEAFQFLDTLAWAALANGQDEEGKQRTAEALAKAPAKEREPYLGYQRDIEAAIAEAPTRLAAAETKLAALDAKVSVRRTWTFGGDEESRSAEFLHNALVDVLAGLNSMAAKERVDVAQRLTWAQQVRAASLAHPKAGATWSAAREAIAKADDVVASKRYSGLSIPLPDEAVIGLAPIGMNPVTKLWEFYDLRSAWDGKQAATEIEIPTHKEDGSIEVKAGTGIVFVLLPGGTVTLGSQNDDPNAPFYDPQHQKDETLHDVTLSPFFLARHELTRGQWQRLAGDQLTQWNEGGHYNGDRIAIGRTHPADSMDWDTGDRWMTRHGMVLPTEAQWEYGARGGTTTVFWPGQTAADLQGCANVHDKTSFERSPQWGEPAPITDGFRGIAPVASFKPNGFGLFDVHGNVWEWCRDWFGDYGSERAGDGLRSDGSLAFRSNRGGCYDNAAVSARSAHRRYYAPSLRFRNLSLRPARLLRP
ncbi:MAG: SUMF1/EgtB/PvdO family nonheme iron enzyme [Planctomycetes bacterium]|nr:SUMF1/EgtB/PvdO family nonheme iron enzyme [Planctomycetota bacterium]